jgi:RNA polymerase sigma factor (sigma-70 family)
MEHKKVESRLLTEFIEGDRQATKVFLREYGGIIKYVVGKIAPKGNVVDAEDLFNEVFAYLFENKKKIILDFKQKCKFSTYLYLISRRYALKKVKEETKVPNALASSPQVEDLPSKLMEETEEWDEEVKKALPLAIQQLDENTRLFIKMYYVDNRSINDIMRMFNWESPNSVYSKKNRVLQKLRKNMKKILKEWRLTQCIPT